MQYRDSFYICAPSEKLKYQESPLSQISSPVSDKNTILKHYSTFQVRWHN